MSKQYGLIDPKANKLKPGLAKHAAFASDSDSDSGPKKLSVNLSLGESQKRQVRAAQQKALAEDPTIYQYDELYDDMEQKRKEAKADKSQEERKPKYIGKLLETADKRKKEQERRIERQIQKEREAEGEMFKDKESFVTSAYRAKLEEMKKAEEEEKREEYLESIGDVMKQGDLGGFYRHIYSQKMGESSSETKTKDSTGDLKQEPKSEDDETPSVKEVSKIKEDTSISKTRRYRKRASNDNDDNDENEKNDSTKKIHLQSNLDADSDFSIDSNSSSDSNSSDSDSSDCEDDKNRIKKDKKPEQKSAELSPKPEVKLEESVEQKPTNGSDGDIKSSSGDSNGKEMVKADEKEVKKEKAPKIDIWKKRTIGDVFDAALQRYFERKAARESG